MQSSLHETGSSFSSVHFMPPVKWVSKCAKQKLCEYVFDSQGSVGQWGRALLHWWACPVHLDCLGSLYRRLCVWKGHTSALATPVMQTNAKLPDRKGRNKTSHTYTRIISPPLSVELSVPHTLFAFSNIHSMQLIQLKQTSYSLRVYMEMCLQC